MQFLLNYFQSFFTLTNQKTVTNRDQQNCLVIGLKTKKTKPIKTFYFKTRKKKNHTKIARKNFKNLEKR